MYYSVLLINYHLLPLPNFLLLYIRISSLIFWAAFSLSLSLSLCLSFSLSFGASSFAPFIALSLSISVRLPFSNLLSHLLCLMYATLSLSPLQPLNVALPHISVSFSPFFSISFLFHPLLRCVPNDNVKTSWLKIPRGSPDGAFPRSLGRWQTGADAERRTARERARETDLTCHARNVPRGQTRGAATTKGRCNRRLYTRIIHDKYLRALARRARSKAQCGRRVNGSASVIINDWVSWRMNTELLPKTQFLRF